METAINMFTDGITSDMHPLTTLENVLTDALNATTITFNGNEMILLNDMGNTLILDTTTGNVMGLNDGFIPVGMKEYGGILYIASYNPSTNEGELGTIPSPNIRYTYQDPASITLSALLAADITGGTEYSELQLTDTLYGAIDDTLYTKIYNTASKAGDLFMIILDISGLDELYIKHAHSGKGTLSSVSYTYPVITKVDLNGNKTYGWYNLKLYSLISGKSPVELLGLYDSPQEYYIKGVEEKLVSDYWFIPASDLDGKEIDTDRCQAEASKGNNLYRLYPNILMGKLAIRLVPNIPLNFLMLTNSSTNTNTPFTFTQITEKS